MHRRGCVATHDVGEDNVVEANLIRSPESVTRISVEEVRSRIKTLGWR